MWFKLPKCLVIVVTAIETNTLTQIGEFKSRKMIQDKNCILKQRHRNVESKRMDTKVEGGGVN